MRMVLRRVDPTPGFDLPMRECLNRLLMPRGLWAGMDPTGICYHAGTWIEGWHSIGQPGVLQAEDPSHNALTTTSTI